MDVCLLSMLCVVR